MKAASHSALATVLELQLSDHPVAHFSKAQKLRATLHFDARALEMLDEKSLVLVLRKDECKRERTESLADVSEGDPGPVHATRPEVDGDEFQAAFDHLVRNPHLSVELQRARVNRKRPRRRPRLSAFCR